MQINLESITDPRVRIFYTLYWPQHEIVAEFFRLVPEAQYDFRMVDAPQRRSDSVRESLAHVIYVTLVYFRAARTGELAFTSAGTEHFATLPRERLLAEWERVDAEMYACLTDPAFDSGGRVAVPWGGEMNVIDLLFFLRDHDILHVGWNLALMDHLDVPRYPSLIAYWGP
jgi:uncharacterized damage-inducible protein DinB